MNRYIPYALVVMAVVFSIFGMAADGLHWPKICALAALHLCFVKLLSGTLQSIFDEVALGQYGKAWTLGALGVSFAVFDIWLVHFGLELMLVDWPTFGVYLASVAFCSVNIFAHWAYTPTVSEEMTEADTIGSNITHLNRKMT
jgi:hypothetical protein